MGQGSALSRLALANSEAERKRGGQGRSWWGAAHVPGSLRKGDPTEIQGVHQSWKHRGTYAMSARTSST